MSFRHTFCQSCDATESNKDICQSCNDLCFECCLYGGEHPPRKCPLNGCKLCSPSCEWCVYKNHTEKREPGKTYNGELPDKCDHIGKTRVEQDKEKLVRVQKRIRDTEAQLEAQKQEKKQLEVAIARQECAENGEKIFAEMQKKQAIEESRKKVKCKLCGGEGHNKRTCSKRAKTSCDEF